MIPLTVQAVDQQVTLRDLVHSHTNTMLVAGRSGHLANLCLASLGMSSSAHLKGSLDLMLMGVLRRGPAHGYAIIAALREQSNGEFDLAEGTIYPALHRLEQAGRVASSVELAQGRRRRTYELTARGRKEFAAQRRDWQDFVTHMQAVLA